MKHKIPLAFVLLTFLICALAIFQACNISDDEVYTPKPMGYYKISFPKKDYQLYDTTCPFSFEYPKYGFIKNDPSSLAEPCWINLHFPSFNGTLHLSYKVVNDNLNEYLEDSYTLAAKHQIKSSGILEQLIQVDSNNVYGLVYEIDGNAASAVQFFLTDSTKHFLRGALYFNEVPNIDSMAPVVNFIKQDIYHLFDSFNWKEAN